MSISSREKILKAIAAVPMQTVPLPGIDLNIVVGYNNPVEQFISVLKGIGAGVECINDLEMVKEKLTRERAGNCKVINTIQTLGKTDDTVAGLTAVELADTGLVYIRGQVGVAENGAVYISESLMVNRLLPFICDHLILLINSRDIVATMHHAYEKISPASEGFGVFIAGPSKTADIEQSLVIGAHGAKSTTVYVYNEY